MIRKIAIFAAFVLFSIYATAQLPKLTFSPHWLPQAQFAGYYVAEKMGFYNAEGLDVKIIHPSASVNAVQSLIEGDADIISLFLISAISSKNSGIDLVNIGQFSQNSALLFVSKKTSNINKLSDLSGKEIGVWSSGFDEVGKALVHSNNFRVEWVPILSTINLFMVGGIDAMTVMWFNEYKQMINSGLNEDELTTFFFSDYGSNIPEDGIYCLNKTLNQRKADLEKFMRATLKGWEYAKDHRPETIDIVLDKMKQGHVPTNKSHQKWMLDKVLELIEPGTKNIKKGELAETDFQKAQSILIDGGYLKEKTGFDDFYKPVQGKGE
jgi:NitT/TauT family transport system substrate-binding protein